MGFFDRFRSTETASEAAATETAPAGTIASLEFRAQVAEEAMTRLEFSREDAGWTRLLEEGKREFSREKLNHHAELCRVYTVANPLIKRGAMLRSAYIFGEGVGTTAKGDEVNEIVQGWLDDQEVREIFSGAEAQETNETSLFTDGNVFFVLFTDPLTGRVRPRKFQFEEIVGTLTNPDDASETWFYRRSFSRVLPSGRVEQVEELHPHYAYRPLTRPRFIGQGKDATRVKWDAPIYHVKVNALEGWKFGIGDAFAALPWARGYKEFLENWMMLTASLARISFQRYDPRGRKGARAERAQMKGLHDAEAGSVANSTDGTRLEAVSKSGATIDSDSGRNVATMAASALGVPVTMLLLDPGQTGARAVAETLDKPLEMVIKQRQEVWREARRQILNYVIDQAALAPRGPLRGRPLRDGHRLTAQLPNQEDRTFTIVFPDVTQTPVETLVNALNDSAQYLPPKFLVQELLRALGERDVDEWLDKMFDEDGNPLTDAAVSFGNAAVQAVRRGENPADLVN